VKAAGAASPLLISATSVMAAGAAAAASAGVKEAVVAAAAVAAAVAAAADSSEAVGEAHSAGSAAAVAAAAAAFPTACGNAQAKLRTWPLLITKQGTLTQHLGRYSTQTSALRPRGDGAAAQNIESATSTVSSSFEARFPKTCFFIFRYTV